MRRIRYQVACSLDGYIAGPQGEYDWIVEEPQIDFAEIFDQFDTLLMGRRTYEGMLKGPGAGEFWGKKVLVFSRTLRQEEHPGVTVISVRSAERLQEFRSRPGKDIWLFGGGELFRSLLEVGLVDTVEPAIIPVLVGGGIPFLPTPAPQTKLTLAGHRVYPSGIVSLEYAVQPPG
ncbi:MAG TPA: dihydrofolate reductase family protein [Gemmatimonadota bacterium]|nr:dihydrofolate reductase family protein [Gemmatimonadota bacterium]